MDEKRTPCKLLERKQYLSNNNKNNKNQNYNYEQSFTSQTFRKTMNVYLQGKKKKVKDNLIAVVIDIENKELLHSSQRFTKRI